MGSRDEAVARRQRQPPIRQERADGAREGPSSEAVDAVEDRQATETRGPDQRRVAPDRVAPFVRRPSLRQVSRGEVLEAKDGVDRVAEGSGERSRDLRLPAAALSYQTPA